MTKNLSIVLLALVQSLGLATLATAQNPQAIQPRPIPLGVSISTTSSTPMLFAGTGGMRVRSITVPDQKFILTNNHVAGAVAPSLCPDSATPGTTEIIQPASLDLGFDPGPGSNFAVGILANKVPIDFTSGADNLVDAAIIMTTPQLTSTDILGIGPPNPSVTGAFVGQSLIKSGRTSGVTTGTVQAVNTTVSVNYGAGCGVARFIHQVTTTASIGTSGDSGSVVLEQGTLTPVGLFFAGSATQGIMNPILHVFMALGVFTDSDTSASMIIQSTSGGPLTPEEMQLARDVQARHEAAVMSLPEVVGMGIGTTDSGVGPAIIVYLKSMTASARNAVPQQLEGIPVRVIESGEFTAF